jgi:hypothetical protein
MSYFDADVRLIDLSDNDWQLYTMNGSGLAAHNINEATKKALREMPEHVASGDGVLTAAKKAYKHVYDVLVKYAEYGACDTEPRGVLVSIIEEFTRRRFETEIDLYWEV